jgi:hypothetical protein
MAGLDLIAIRVALAEQVQAGTSREINGYPYPKGNEELPCIVVHPADEYVDWYGSLGANDGALCVVNLVLELMAPCRVTYEDGLRVLDEMMSAGVGLPNSVIDAIEADRTLAGTVDDALLGVSSGHTGTRLEDGRPTAVVCRMPLTVWQQRS